MPIRPRKRVLSAGLVGAAQELGELNPLEKARQAIAGPETQAPPGRTNEGRVRQSFQAKHPHSGRGMADVKTTHTPRRTTGFGGVTRKDSPSRKKMRNRGPRNQ